MKEKTYHALTEFTEKAKKLQRFGLIEHLRTTGRGFRMSPGNEGGTIIEFDLPDEKELDATLLTLRLFIQQNESFSFHQFENLSNDPALSNEFRDQLLKVRRAFFDYLNGYPKMVKLGFFEEGKQPNRSEILNVVLYGGISHANNYERREKYRLWSRDDIRESVLLQEFSEIILNILNMIVSILEPIENELSKN